MLITNVVECWARSVDAGLMRMILLANQWDAGNGCKLVFMAKRGIPKDAGRNLRIGWNAETHPWMIIGRGFDGWEVWDVGTFLGTNPGEDEDR